MGSYKIKMLLSYQVLWEDNNEGSIGFLISVNSPHKNL